MYMKTNIIRKTRIIRKNLNIRGLTRAFARGSLAASVAPDFFFFFCFLFFFLAPVSSPLSLKKHEDG